MSAPADRAHIPDPNLITLYAERGDSVLHRLDPRAKVGALAWLVLFVTLVQSAWLLVLAWAGTVVVYRLAGLPLRELLRWYVIPALFVLSLVVFLVWEEPGTPVLEVGGIVLTTGASSSPSPWSPGRSRRSPSPWSC